VIATEEEIAAAEAYENLHVTALFQQWAPQMADAARIQPGHRVLDVACGTGVLARQILPIVGDSGSVAGLDASVGMLTVANQLSPSIDWQHGVAESLPFDDGLFDAVVCQFGLMFFQDRLAALREMLRVLAPAGWLSIAVWESLENSEAYREEVELLERHAGREAADALRAPFALGSRDELSGLFHDVGMDSALIETNRGTARFPSVRMMVEADLRGWLPLMGVNLSESLIETILSNSEEALSQYVRKDGTVEFEAPALIVCGRHKTGRQ
jgi:SAM-dependent methyltransferase